MYSTVRRYTVDDQYILSVRLASATVIKEEKLNRDKRDEERGNRHIDH